MGTYYFSPVLAPSDRDPNVWEGTYRSLVADLVQGRTGAEYAQLLAPDPDAVTWCLVHVEGAQSVHDYFTAHPEIVPLMDDDGRDEQLASRDRGEIAAILGITETVYGVPVGYDRLAPMTERQLCDSFMEYLGYPGTSIDRLWVKPSRPGRSSRPPRLAAGSLELPWRVAVRAFSLELAHDVRRRTVVHMGLGWSTNANGKTRGRG